MYNKTDFTRQVITRTLSKINKRNSVCERMLVDSTYWVGRQIVLVLLLKKTALKLMDRSVYFNVTNCPSRSTSWEIPASVTVRLLAAHIVIRIESLLRLFGPEDRSTSSFESEGTAYESTQRNVIEDFSLNSSIICSMFFPFSGLKIWLTWPSQNSPEYNTLVLADRCENDCQMWFWVFIFMCCLAIFGLLYRFWWIEDIAWQGVVLEQTGPAGMPLCGRGDPTWWLKRHSTGERASAHHDLDTRHEGTADTAVN